MQYSNKNIVIYFQNAVFLNTCVLYVTLSIPNRRKPGKTFSKIKGFLYKNKKMKVAHSFKTLNTKRQKHMQNVRQKKLGCIPPPILVWPQHLIYITSDVLPG